MSVLNANSFPTRPKTTPSSSKLGRTSSDTNPEEEKPLRDKMPSTPKTKNAVTKSLNFVKEPSSSPKTMSDEVLGGDSNLTRAKESRNGSTSKSGYPFTRLDVPSGFLPPGFKDCLLSNVVRSGRRALEHLKEVRESLSNLVAEDEQLSRGVKKVNPPPDILQLSIVAEALTVLTREAFVPTHRLNQTAIALYSAEDFLRYPKDIQSFDAIGRGRIKVPDLAFNEETVKKLRVVVDKSTEYYNKFNLKGPNGAELQDIMFTLMRAFQDLYTLVLGCQEIFKVLLYTSAKEKANLQQFLLSLQSMERSDMLTEVQDLRRLTDELVIFLEKLSWGCFVVYRLASGKTIPVQKESDERVPSGKGQGQGSSKFKDGDHNMYPDLPFLGKGKGKGQKSSSAREKKASMDKVMTNGEGKKLMGRKGNEFDFGAQDTKKGKKSKGTKKKGFKGASNASLYGMMPPTKSKISRSKSKFLP